MAAYVSLLESKARTADTTSKHIINWQDFKIAHLVVDVTAGAPNLIIDVKAYDNASTKSYTLLTSSTINSGTTVLKIGPDYSATTNVAKDYLPYEWYVTVTQSGGVSSTYTIGASMI